METNIINVALVGAVSAGKSTLLNAIFTSKYSEMKKKRTTMIPQIYSESPSMICQSKADILSKNSRLNHNNSGILRSCKDVTHRVERIKNFVELKHCYFKIYDLPGLNDGNGNGIVVYKYLEQNFHKFDIVIYVVDINSCLNTSDEIKMFEKLVDLINLNKRKTKLLVLINKCDDMNYKEKHFGFSEEDLELYKTIETKIKGKINCDILPVSAETAYIYRIYKENPEVKLDPTHLNRLGTNECGKRFIKWSNTEKSQKIKEVMKRVDYNEVMIDTGFSSFAKKLSELCDEKQIIIRHFCEHLHNFEIKSKTHYNEWIDIVRYEIDNQYSWFNQEIMKRQKINQGLLHGIIMKYVKKISSTKNIPFNQITNIAKELISICELEYKHYNYLIPNQKILKKIKEVVSNQYKKLKNEQKINLQRSIQIIKYYDEIKKYISFQFPDLINILNEKNLFTPETFNNDDRQIIYYFEIIQGYISKEKCIKIIFEYLFYRLKHSREINLMPHTVKHCLAVDYHLSKIELKEYKHQDLLFKYLLYNRSVAYSEVLNIDSYDKFPNYEYEKSIEYYVLGLIKN